MFMFVKIQNNCNCYKFLNRFKYPSVTLLSGADCNTMAPESTPFEKNHEVLSLDFCSLSLDIFLETLVEGPP